MGLGSEDYSDDECEGCEGCSGSMYLTESEAAMDVPIQFELVSDLDPYRRMIVDMFMEGPPGGCRPERN